MEEIIKKASKLNVEVFMAISILHKKYISQFVDQVKNLPEEEQKKFFEEKKIEFFKSIKFTLEEYENFLKNHPEEINEYIIQNEKIRNYLTTIN